MGPYETINCWGTWKKVMGSSICRGCKFLEDFDNDGTSECIGLTVSEITIFQEPENPVNLLNGNFQIPEDFLKKFSRYNFDGFCLGTSILLFTKHHHPYYT